MSKYNKSLIDSAYQSGDIDSLIKAVEPMVKVILDSYHKRKLLALSDDCHEDVTQAAYLALLEFVEETAFEAINPAEEIYRRLDGAMQREIYHAQRLSGMLSLDLMANNVQDAVDWLIKQDAVDPCVDLTHNDPERAKQLDELLTYLDTMRNETASQLVRDVLDGHTVPEAAKLLGLDIRTAQRLYRSTVEHLKKHFSVAN